MDAVVKKTIDAGASRHLDHGISFAEAFRVWLRVALLSFGESWHRGEDPLPWSAHEALWHTLERYADQVRYQKRLSGVRPLMVAAELAG